MSAFLKAGTHPALFYEAKDLSGAVTASAGNITTHLTLTTDGRTVAHLINHNYNQAFIEQDNVVVSFPMASAPATVTLVSPDFTQDTAATFTYSGGLVTVTVPQLISYVGMVAQ
jgi:hypothetical protein